MHIFIQKFVLLRLIKNDIFSVLCGLSHLPYFYVSSVHDFRLHLLTNHFIFEFQFKHWDLITGDIHLMESLGAY